MFDKINLSDDGIATLDIVTMPVYEPFRGQWQDKKKPALIIVPGGSYIYCSEREALPVSFEFLSKGYQTFILTYHLKDDSDYPRPFMDLSKAIKYVKDNNQVLGIDPDNISLIGFSAGGHLVGTYGALIDSEKFQLDMDMSKEDLAVKNIVLGYPAIYLEPIVEDLALNNNLDKVGKMFTSYQKYKDGYEMAHKGMPRTFVFQAIDDPLVPAIATLEYVKRLVELGVDVEFYMSNVGGHGFSTGDDLSNFSRNVSHRAHNWVDLVDRWIKDAN